MTNAMITGKSSEVVAVRIFIYEGEEGGPQCLGDGYDEISEGEAIDLVVS